MKKILFRMCLAAAVLCSSITVSSCDENSPWLQIIKNLLGTNTTYTYSGTATYQCLSEPNSQGAYTKTLANFSQQSSQVSLTTTSVNETEATVVLPAASQNGVSMSAVTLLGTLHAEHRQYDHPVGTCRWYQRRGHCYFRRSEL